jgi:predicted metal-dependent phosphoesterase TrpH
MTWLKADLHAHCGDDPNERIGYSAEMLIDAAAQLNVEVLAIAPHGARMDNARLAVYAARRNVLLIPAAELRLEGKHVLVLNPDEYQARVRTFAELRAAGRRGAAIIAPHPYYPGPVCLGRALAENIDLFDAVEYCSLYFRGLDPNRKAVRMAQKHRLPLVGTSDAHTLPYSDSTFTWVQSESRVEEVIAAIRAGRVRLTTSPRPMAQAARMLYFSAWQAVRGVIHCSD